MVISTVRVYLCVSDRVSQRYQSVWQGKRAAETVFGHFKLLGAITRRKLYNFKNAHYVTPQYTGWSH